MSAPKLTRSTALRVDPLPAWMGEAACAAPETRGLPWTSDTRETPTVLVELMRETCAGCPVRLACAAFAARGEVTGGWWAGLDRDPHPGQIKQARPARLERVDVERLPRGVPVYNRAGDLIDHQLVLFPHAAVDGIGGAA